MDDRYDELAFPDGFAAGTPGTVAFVPLDKIQSSFGNGPGGQAGAQRLKRAQDKLLACAYYGGGNMHGVRKLFDKVRTVRVDKGQPIGPGDRVRISGSKETHAVSRRANGQFVLERLSTNKALKRRYARDELTLVHGITRDRVAEFLENQEVYQLSRRPRRIKDFRAVVPAARRAILQLDLIGPMVAKGKTCRDLYGLVVVDVLTRKAWTAPLRQKTAQATGAAFVRMLPGIAAGGGFDRVPKKDGVPEVLLSSDNGGEFTEVALIQQTAAWGRANGVRFRQVFGIPGEPNSQAVSYTHLTLPTKRIV